VFDSSSPVIAQTQAKITVDFSNILISPSALLLLCHFTNNIAASEQQVIRTLSHIYNRMPQSEHLLTVDTLLRAIQKMQSHSLNNFREMVNDAKLAERQMFVFNQQQLTFRRAIDFVTDLLVNQI
jgi:hypothetical protein